MTREVERLLVKIKGDANPYVATLSKTEQRTEGFRAKVSTAVGIAGGAVKAFGAAAVAGLGVASAVFVSTATDIDRVAKNSSKLGVPTAKFAGLELAAEKSGVAVNALTTGMQRATRRIAEAAGGTGVAVSALSDLGLEARSLAQLSPDQQFERIADAFEGIDSQAEKVRLGFKLFDSEGVGLINTMKGGSAAIQAVQKEAVSLGLALSEFDTSRVERANDALKLLQRSSTGVARQFTAAAAPLVEVLATIFVESQGDIRAWRSVFESATDFAQAAVVNVVGAWLRLDSAADFVVGKIVRGWALTIKGAGFFFNAVDSVAKKLGITLAGKVGAALDGIAGKAEGLATEFETSSVKTAGSIDRVTGALDRRINAARRIQGAATPPPAVTGDVGGNEAAKRAQAEADAERERQLAALAALERSLLSRREIIEADFAKRLEQLSGFREAELIDEARHAELIAASVFDKNAQINELEQAAAARREAIAEKERRTREAADRKSAQLRIRVAQGVASGLQSIGNLIVTAAGRQSTAAIAVQKAFAISAIAINTAVGASRAIAELGPIAGPIAAGAIIAGGAASVARVLATSPGNTAALGGGGRGGGGGGAGGNIGEGDVCGAVNKVQQCGGKSEGDSDRLGDEKPIIQIVQIGDNEVDTLIDKIRERTDSGDRLLFSDGTAQAEELG